MNLGKNRLGVTSNELATHPGEGMILQVHLYIAWKPTVPVDKIKVNAEVSITFEVGVRTSQTKQWFKTFLISIRVKIKTK